MNDHSPFKSRAEHDMMNSVGAELNRIIMSAKSIIQIMTEYQEQTKMARRQDDEQSGDNLLSGDDSCNLCDG